ncbi:protein rep, partial [Escherichia coli]|uniref:protein rep n=1 Tax=Escherichia coli TaxID=562 RepID=UPI0015D5F881
VPSSWFKRDYVKHERWVEIWSECLRVDYAAGAHIKRVRPNRGSVPEGASAAEVQRAALEAGVIETLKYTVKSSEIVRDPA